MRLTGVDVGIKTRVTLSNGYKFNSSYWQLANMLANTYDIICTETLSNIGYNPSASSPMLIEFLADIGKRCRRFGKIHIQIDKYFPSTIMCCFCKAKTGPNSFDKLNIRRWICATCNSVHDRDVNAAINIRNEGLRIFSLTRDK